MARDSSAALCRTFVRYVRVSSLTIRLGGFVLAWWLYGFHVHVCTASLPVAETKESIPFYMELWFYCAVGGAVLLLIIIFIVLCCICCRGTKSSDLGKGTRFRNVGATFTTSCIFNTDFGLSRPSCSFTFVIDCIVLHSSCFMQQCMHCF